MEQRDLIKEEAERLGQVIGKLIALVIGTGGGNQDNAALETTISKALKEELGTDLHQLLDLSTADLRAFVRDQKLLPYHVELLADLFAEWAERESNRAVSLQLAGRALTLYDLGGELSGTFCFFRAEREQKLRKKIKSGSA